MARRWMTAEGYAAKRDRTAVAGSTGDGVPYRMLPGDETKTRAAA
jgi:hypothetical protein